MESKLKVLIICSFSNEMVRKHLPLDNRKMYNKLRGLLGLPASGGGYADVASWDTNLIDNLSKRADIDLYVVSAHSGLKKSQVHFSENNVNYWFVRCEVATMLKHIIKSPALWHRLNPMRPIVRRIVYEVNPDVVALMGAENPHYSGTVIGLEKDFPVIVKAQTIYNNPNRKQLTGKYDEKNAYVERLIFSRLKYFSVTTKVHCEMFRKFNPDAYNLKWSFATTFPDVVPMAKVFDFVNYAMQMSEGKGYPDAVKALAIVKKQYPNVKMSLVGGGSKDMIDALGELINELQLQDNVVLTPLFPKQSDMFQHIQKSRFALLPCKLDYVSSTIRQAMHYELPVICYKTEGTVRLNEGEERVLIAENGDYKDLAVQMLRFMNEPDTVEHLRKAAKTKSDEINDNIKITNQIVADFMAVINNFKDGSAIPSELLYD